MDALAHLVPTLSVTGHTATSGPLLQLPLLDATLPSIVPGPTPRPGSDIEAECYFGSNPHGPTEAVQRFLHALSHIDQIRKCSIQKFFTWRPAHPPAIDLASSQTSHNSSSGVEAVHMPTVARAMGGGEWEANLSRRLAKRRQSTPHTETSEHTRRTTNSVTSNGKRKSSTSTSYNSMNNSRKKADPTPFSSSSSGSCGSLFPSIPTSDPFGARNGGGGGKGVSLGIGELFNKTFGGMRKGWRWKWGMVAATALALAVGWNWVKAG